MRTLVCITGIVAEPRLVWPNLKKHVVDVLGADVCLATAKGHVPDELDLKYAFEYEENYGDLHGAYDFMRECEDGKEWRDLKVIGDNWLRPLGNITEGTGGITLFYKWFLWKNLSERNLIDEYDQFVITRGDYLHVADIIKPVNDTILIPGYEFHGGVCDRFAIVPREYITKFLRLGTGIVREPEKLLEIYNKQSWPLKGIINGWNGETFTCIMLLSSRLWEHISFYKPTMFTASENPPPSRFCHTMYCDTHKCYLRYRNEYRNVIKNINDNACNFIYPVSNVNWGYVDPESSQFVGKIM
tara:strand:+ start:4454 stop:5353 length:900 start_codon:yes stop_codon:yes gene_type:complete